MTNSMINYFWNSLVRHDLELQKHHTQIILEEVQALQSKGFYPPHYCKTISEAVATCAHYAEPMGFFMESLEELDPSVVRRENRTGITDREIVESNARVFPLLRAMVSFRNEVSRIQVEVFYDNWKGPENCFSFKVQVTHMGSQAQELHPFVRRRDGHEVRQVWRKSTDLFRDDLHDSIEFIRQYQVDDHIHGCISRLEKGYGFIETVSSDERIFFHFKEWKGSPQERTLGTSVVFRTVDRPDRTTGHMRRQAVEVTVDISDQRFTLSEQALRLKNTAPQYELIDLEGQCDSQGFTIGKVTEWKSGYGYLSTEISGMGGLKPHGLFIHPQHIDNFAGPDHIRNRYVKFKLAANTRGYCAVEATLLPESFSEVDNWAFLASIQADLMDALEGLPKLFRDGNVVYGIAKPDEGIISIPQGPTLGVVGLPDGLPVGTVVSVEVVIIQGDLRAFYRGGDTFEDLRAYLTFKGIDESFEMWTKIWEDHDEYLVWVSAKGSQHELVHICVMHEQISGRYVGYLHCAVLLNMDVGAVQGYVQKMVRHAWLDALYAVLKDQHFQVKYDSTDVLLTPLPAGTLGHLVKLARGHALPKPSKKMRTLDLGDL